MWVVWAESDRLASANGESSRFWGLMSRWMMLRVLRKWSASAAGVHLCHQIAVGCLSIETPT